MQSPLLHGVVPAVATPLLSGTEQVDEIAAARLVDFLIAAGVHGLFALGSTGEAVLLELEQRKRVAELVIARAAGKLPVFVHVGALRPAEVVALSRHAEQSGASGIAVLPPYYYGLDDAALERFFSEIAEAVRIPIYLYHIPMNAKNSIRVPLFTRLAQKYPHILGLKDSGMDFSYFQELVRAKQPHHSAMMGNDAQILVGLVTGGQGAVSAGATAIPEPYVKLWNAWKAGDLPTARKWQDICARVRTMFVKPYPISPIKHVLHLRGISAPDVMRPLRPLSQPEAAAIEAEFRAIESSLR